MNLEFFFVVLAHLLLLSTFIIILPLFKSSKNSKLKFYKRWTYQILKSTIDQFFHNKNKSKIIEWDLLSESANLNLI